MVVSTSLKVTAIEVGVAQELVTVLDLVVEAPVVVAVEGLVVELAPPVLVGQAVLVAVAQGPVAEVPEHDAGRAACGIVRLIFLCTSSMLVELTPLAPQDAGTTAARAL